MMKMDEHSNAAPESSESVLSIIRKLHSGELEAKSLGADDRRRCGEHMVGEGYSTVEIAEVLKVSERTIARDRAATRQANALKRDPAFASEMAGNLVRHADLAVSRIRRVTRDRDTPPNVKVDGERACWTINRELVQSLQELGHLPKAPQEIRGDLTHHLAEPPAMAAIRDELQRVMEIQRREAADDDAVLASLSGIKKVLNTLEAAQPDDAPDGAQDREPNHGNA